MMNPIFRLFCLTAAAIAVSTTLCIGQDVTPPELLDFDLSESVLDVTGGAQQLSGRVELADDMGGVAGAVANFISPSGNQTQSISMSMLDSGDSLTGTFTGVGSFPEFAESGTWTVSSLLVADTVGNSIEIGPVVLAGKGLPTQIVITSNPDTTAPVLDAVDFFPNVVDVSGGDQIVTVAISATDDLSGINLNGLGLEFAIAGPGVSTDPKLESQSRWVPMAAFEMANGTDNDGIWAASFTMPKHSAPGTWSVFQLMLKDGAGNTLALTTPDQIEAATGSVSALTVRSSEPDTTPPALLNLAISPSTLNTSREAALVTVDIAASDDISGVDVSGTSEFSSFLPESGVLFESPSGQQIRIACCGGLSFTGGTPFNGTWRGTTWFPAFSEDGTWRIKELWLKDRVRNLVVYDTDQLRSMGFPTDIVVLQPSDRVDGTAGPSGGLVRDDTFIDRAIVRFPPDVLERETSVTIDVFGSAMPDAYAPSGYRPVGTHYVSFELAPPPDDPFKAPGLALVLPIEDAIEPGTMMHLFTLDPDKGELNPAFDVDGERVMGLVDDSGLSATFVGVSHLSTVVGFVPEIIPVQIDIFPGKRNATINTQQRWPVPVLIYSSRSFDALEVDPESILLGGASVEKWFGRRPIVFRRDFNGDGRRDLYLVFRSDRFDVDRGKQMLVLIGETFGGAEIFGEDSVNVVSRNPWSWFWSKITSSRRNDDREDDDEKSTVISATKKSTDSLEEEEEDDDRAKKKSKKKSKKRSKKADRDDDNDDDDD